VSNTAIFVTGIAVGAVTLFCVLVIIIGVIDSKYDVKTEDEQRRIDW
jgi:hypothetical protein